MCSNIFNMVININHFMNVTLQNDYIRTSPKSCPFDFRSTTTKRLAHTFSAIFQTKLAMIRVEIRIQNWHFYPNSGENIFQTEKHERFHQVFGASDIIRCINYEHFSDPVAFFPFYDGGCGRIMNF